jgi:hypothetical protein
VFEYTLSAGPTGVAAVLEVEPVAAPVAAAAPAAVNPVALAKELLAAGLSTADAAAGSGLPETVVAALANTL